MIKDNSNDQDPVDTKKLIQNARDNILDEFRKEKQQLYLTNKRRNPLTIPTNLLEDITPVELSTEVTIIFLLIH